MTIEVTETDIKNGYECNSYSCPVALAVKRELPESYVSVGTEFLRIDAVNHALPMDVQRFIHDFDRGCNYPWQPFSFEIDHAFLQQGQCDGDRKDDCGARRSLLSIVRSWLRI